MGQQEVNAHRPYRRRPRPPVPAARGVANGRTLPARRHGALRRTTQWRRAMILLGVDVGGSGIKGAPVDLEQGILTAERLRLPTPQPSKPQAVAEVVAEVARHFDWHGPLGCTFPGVVKHGVVYTAANVDKSWIGTDARRVFEAATGCPVLLLNDADAAGLAEVRFGAGRDEPGVVVL